MNDIKRLILYVAFSFIALALWVSWQKEGVVSSPTTQVVSAPSALGASLPQAPLPQSQQKPIQIETDTYLFTVDLPSGQLSHVALKNYKAVINNPEPFILFSDDAQQYYVGQTILLNASQQPEAVVFHSAQDHYTLAPEQNGVSVVLIGKTSSGIEVTKTLTFKRGTYVVLEAVQLNNASKTPWTGYLSSSLMRQYDQPSKTGLFNVSAYTGAAISDPDNKHYEKVPFKSMQADPLSRDVKGGWVAMQQHYFLTALIPSKDQPHQFYTQAAANHVYTIGIKSMLLSLAPGQTINATQQWYLGPELQDQLQAISPSLDLTIDYGFLWFIGTLLFHALEALESVLGNWGLAIIALTILIKVAFYSLSAKSYRSMAGMKRLQPKMEALKERYGEDKQKYTQAVMELYKQEKINPLGGCLPILVQLPVFIALYWVLMESIELRQAPFYFWIKDLSAPDPYFVLPILMGLSMLLQQKMNPPPADPTQAKMMMILPVALTALFLYFPAGLVLYWLVNNLLSIAQQAYITKRCEATV